jgi:glycosyltransferase involved in cell wall biosynthesis
VAALDESLPIKISVIVPAWNASATIARCISALIEQSYSSDPYEIIVVDNGSTDDTVSRIPQDPRVIVLSESAPGSYAARNRALAVARGEYVAFTDADCAPDEHWLAAGMAAAAAAPSGDLVWTGPIELFAEEGCQPIALAYERLFSFDQKVNVNLGRCVTANWLSRRATIEQLGGFDATLKSGGDLKASREICARGGRVVYVEGMVVRHPARATLGELVAKKRRTVGGAWMNARPARPVLRLASNLVKDMARRLLKIVRTPGLPASTKVGLSVAVLRINFAALLEIGRLRRGGEPSRA